MALSKSIGYLSRKLGHGGSSFPGLIINKLDQNFLDYFHNQLKHVIMVTGTNGKTTTSGIISNILKSAGFKVLANDEGANLISGITTAFINASTIDGEIDADAAVLEVDEASLPHVLKYIKPDLLLITNFFRDQLDRYGELDKIVNTIKDALSTLSKNTKLVLNADDPFVTSMAFELQKKVTYYGLECEFLESDMAPSFEQKYCSFCGSKIEYQKIYFAHLGKYYCRTCRFKRPKPQISIKNIEESCSGETIITIQKENKNIEIKATLPGFYNYYNILAATSACLEIGIPIESIMKGVANFKPKEGRMQKLTINGREITVSLVKNPAGFDAVLSSLKNINNKKMLIIINDNYADGRDVSWLWDVDFERYLKNEHINFIITSGLRAYDMALRLKYAGIDQKKIRIIPEINKALQSGLSIIPENDILHILPNYTSFLELKGILKKYSK